VKVAGSKNPFTAGLASLDMSRLLRRSILELAKVKSMDMMQLMLEPAHFGLVMPRKAPPVRRPGAASGRPRRRMAAGAITEE
jgi:hypothetical protein